MYPNKGFLQQYFIAVPFNFYDHNQMFKQEMLDAFKEYQKIDGLKGNNAPYINEKYSVPIMDAFEGVVAREFDVGKNTKEDRIPYVYCQTDKQYVSEYHNHIQSSTINAVTYIDLPSEGGELEVECCGLHTIKVHENYLYLFPGWMIHRPLPQKDTSWRICVNLEYVSSDNAPYCKSTKTRW